MNRALDSRHKGLDRGYHQQAFRRLCDDFPDFSDDALDISLRKWKQSHLTLHRNVFQLKYTVQELILREEPVKTHTRTPSHKRLRERTSEYSRCSRFRQCIHFRLLWKMVGWIVIHSFAVNECGLIGFFAC